MGQKTALRIKLTTGDGNIGILVLVLAKTEKKITETITLGGQNRELAVLTLDLPYMDFRSKLLDARFYGKYNPPVTGDLERYLQKSVRNLDFIDRLYGALAASKKNDLQFLFVNELMVVLGNRDIDFDYVHEELSAQAEQETEEPALTQAQTLTFDPEEPPAAGDAPNPARYVPLVFALSPITGTPLHDLLPGEQVFVRVGDRKHPLGEAFLAMQAALVGGEEKAEHPDEFLASLIELRPNPVGGFFAILSLPDASEGLVVEAESGIRVKRPQEQPAPAEATPAETDAGPRETRFDPPLKGYTAPVERGGIPVPVIIGILGAAVLAGLLLLLLL